MLRQQGEHDDSRPNRSLADFVAPARPGCPTTSAPSPSAIHGADELAAAFERDGDDYSAIMVKALADRLAEAFAEWLHEQARRAWYAPDERLSNEELVARALPRDPPGVRLSRVPGPLGEAARSSTLLDADRAGLDADGVVRDDSRPRA